MIREKPELLEKNSVPVPLSATNLIRAGPESNPGLRGERSATIHLNSTQKLSSYLQENTVSTTETERLNVV
jgi:hypothetical protein